MKQIISSGFAMLLFGAVALAGCATTKDKDYALQDALNAYESTIRWVHFERLVLFHSAESLQAGRLPENASELKVTSYRPLVQRAGADGNSLDQTVEIKYYYWSQAKEQTTRQVQHWVYDADKARWQITTAPPTFE